MIYLRLLGILGVVLQKDQITLHLYPLCIRGSISCIFCQLRYHLLILIHDILMDEIESYTIYIYYIIWLFDF